MSCTKQRKTIKLIYMTRKIRKFLDENDYNYLELNLETEGDYSPRDWNGIIQIFYIFRMFINLLINLY